jgi:hypothetical protein
VTRAEFWILNGLSLFLALVIAFELFSSNALDEAQAREKQAQLPILQAEQLQPLARQMIERTAQAAIRDPALKDVLAKYGFKITPAATGDAGAPNPIVIAPSHP